MMAPFMSCSARLTVYILFATAFFTEHAALLVFVLYLLGIAAAVLTAWILKHTLLPGEAPPLLMELPIYHRPALLNIALNTKNKLRGFVMNAGKIIVIIVVILNFFNSMGTDGSFGNDNQANSVLSTLAKTATPIVEPLGITEENWPATVGLITGLLAKEVVVGALDALYKNIDQTTKPESDAPYEFGTAMGEAFATIPANITGIVTNLLDPLGLKSIGSADNLDSAAEELQISTTTIQKMSQYFGGSIAAFAYLILVLLYFPCVATLGAMKQELGWRWMMFSAGWSLFLGYTLAVGFYQTMTFQAHPQTSMLWLLMIALSYLILWLILRHFGKKLGPRQVVNPSF